MRKRILVLAVVLSLFMAFAAQAAVIYVAKTGSDSTGNGSVSAPYATIQHGIDQADPGDTVQVGLGTYAENINFFGKAITVTGTNPDSVSVVTGTVIDGGQNTSVVTFTSGETIASVITGFTITNGREQDGAGIYCASSSPTISKNVITANSATDTGAAYPPHGGGGIYCESGSPVITGNTIVENSSWMGAGIHCFNCPNVTVSGNAIRNNQALYGGGGICLYRSSGAVSGNTIADNFTDDWDGGGILVQKEGTVNVLNNVITGNAANAGGGISFREGGPNGTISGNRISGNETDQWGGAGIHCCQYGTVTIRNNLFSGNLARQEGGGGLLLSGSGTATVASCTIVQNEADAGQGGGIAINFGSNVTVRNCIVNRNSCSWGAQIGIWGTGGELPILRVTYSCVQGGRNAIFTNEYYSLTYGAGNSDSDPLFAALGDYPGLIWVDGDYHLKSMVGRWDPSAAGGSGAWVSDAANSPCIDAGDPGSAYASEPAPNGGRINMGAYGNTAFASKTGTVTMYQVTLQVSPVSSGTTTPAAGVYSVPEGQAWGIQATPSGSNVFQGWTASPGANASFANAGSASTTVTVTGAVTVTANFGVGCALPTFLPVAGSYNTAKDITLSTATSGAAIRYTTDGSTPTGASQLYASAIHVAATTTIKAIATKAGMLDSAVATAAYTIDSQAPVVSGVGAVPNVIRQGVDTSLQLTATADDSSTGNSPVTAAEYFIGADPGTGSGTPMSAATGALDSAVETLVATVSTSAWNQGSYRIYVRARDGAGNWSAAGSVLVNTVDGVPPGKINNLSAAAAPSFPSLPATIGDYSSAMQGTPPGALLDGNATTFWQTGWSATPDPEFVILDLLSVKTVGGLSLTPAMPGTLFPSQLSIELSQDGADWTTVAVAAGLKAAKGAFIWQFDPTDARYVRISGRPVLNRAEHLYCWQIAGAAVLSSGGTFVRLMWTAPADNGYTGSPASQYDVRWAPASITTLSFESCNRIAVSAPKNPGSQEQVIIATCSPGEQYIAVKTGDEVPNWSDMSNVTHCAAAFTGLASDEPADACSPGAVAPTFRFTAGAALKPVFIAFSSSPAFVARPTPRQDGQVDATVRFPVQPAVGTWTPSSGQWKSIKGVACDDGVLHWRLEARSRDFAAMFGPARSIVFNTGNIGFTDPAVSPSHDSGDDTAVWPDPVTIPRFEWIDATIGMQYFFVDVSRSPSVPLGDKKTTIVLGARGITGTKYTPTAAEWKAVRKLATWLANPKGPEPACGVLYWRVRAVDADKALSCASGVQKLVIDGDGLAVDPVDLSSVDPVVRWNCAAQGLAAYRVEFSVSDAFERSAKKTLVLPPVAANQYALSEAEKAKLAAFAARNSAATLHYRVRGEDAEKAFVAYSPSASTPAP